MKIGDKIKELRLEKGLSQVNFGKLVGVSQKAVDYWERNVNEPKASYIISIVKVFDISFDDFFAERVNGCNIADKNIINLLKNTW